MNRKILVTFAFAFGFALAGCSGSYSEGSDRASSELAKKGGAPGKGEPGKGEPSKDEAPSKDEGGKDVPDDSTGDKDPSGEKDPGKDVPSDDSCFTIVLKDSCQSDETWKAIASKTCEGKGLSLDGLSTSGDCKDGSTVAKISCCK